MGHQRIRVFAHLLRFALRRNLAIGQNNHMVGNRKGFFELMRDKHTGQTHGIIELTDQPCSGSQRDRIETGKRFVIHHELRIQRNGACQRHAARHATRNFAGHQMTCTPQANGIEFHQHDIADHVFGQRRMLTQRESHVLEHAEVGEQGAKLKQHTHAPARRIQLLLVHGTDILVTVRTVQTQLALLGPVLTTNQTQYGGLAAA